MLWPRDSYKHVIIYDGTDISWTGIEGPEDVKFKVSSLQIRKDMLQAAVDIVQMYDIFQYSNCQKSQKFPKGSAKRTKFLLGAHEERLLEFLALSRVAMARPSDKIEQALAYWILILYNKISFGSQWCCSYSGYI